MSGDDQGLKILPGKTNSVFPFFLAIFYDESLIPVSPRTFDPFS